MKKISIIGTVGVPAKFGGFETLAEFIVRHLATKYRITVFCSSKHYQDRKKNYKSARRIFLPFRANGIQSIVYDVLSILISVFKVDTLLILGVSGCIILPIIKPFHNKKVIVSTDGLEWKRDKWSKFAKWFLKLSERIAVKYSDIVIADNENIQNYITSEFNVNSTLIEYGGDQSVPIKPCKSDYERFPFLKKSYSLSVSRIESENNCGMILKTFSDLPDKTHVHIGNWDRGKYSKTLFKRYSSCSNIILLNAIHNIDTLNVIRSNCTMYIHGHSVGGTNPALVEAMYVGLPIIAYDVSYNRTTTKNDALYFKNSAELIEKINTLENDKDVLDNISNKMKKIANIHYNWESIMGKYCDII